MNNYQAIRAKPLEIIAGRDYNTQVTLSYLLNYPQMNYVAVQDINANYNLSNKVSKKNSSTEFSNYILRTVASYGVSDLKCNNANYAVSYNAQAKSYVAQDVKPYAQSCGANSGNAMAYWGCNSQIDMSYAIGSC